MLLFVELDAKQTFQDKETFLRLHIKVKYSKRLIIIR
jgi:hypothetical protein